MRRYTVLALIALMLSQSSGGALAATQGSGPKMNLADLVVPVEKSIASSRLYADLTGSGPRYAEQHAPPPVMERRGPELDAAALMRSRHALRPRIRAGVRQHVIMPDTSALNPLHRRLDPVAMRRSPRRLSSEPPSNVSVPNVSVLEPLHSLVARTSNKAPALTPGRSGKIRQMTSSNLYPGIEHWWTYEERAIPGVGKAMVNVGTGNLLVTAMDVDIHEQGIDLAFQRVYNSQSLHDVNGDDGGDPAIFGNLWTNDLDASIVYDPVAVTITVYDIDGTACVYTSDGNGNWIPCTGEYATLTPTDGTDCTYAWTKTNGTVYWFHADISGGGCSIPQSKKGQLQEILARNQNNHITFTYSYYGSSKTSEDISEIDVQHSDGDTLYMYFGVIPGTSINELSTITELAPAQQSPVGTLQYLYDASGNLVEVDKPGNNSAHTIPNPPSTLPQGDAPETYSYVSGTYALQEACGPRCTVAMWNNPSGPTDGGALLFTLTSSMQLTNWQFNGVLNFTPSDGTNTPLHQTGSTAFTTWYTATFVYGQGSGCNNTSTGTTTMCDTDGHGTNWTLNANNSVTYTRNYTGTSENQWITTQQKWDNTNDLIAAIDANGNETDFAYNSGNMVEMQLPQMSDITNGPLAPLSLYSYDSNHNITSYCDPVYSQNHGKTWTASPGLAPCPGGNNSTNMTYATPSTEPFGCLTNITKPSGYSTDITYTGDGAGACGVGLPTKVQAHSAISQVDTTTRQPTQDFGYDANGNLTSYDKGQGTSGNLQQSWTLGYNKDNMNTERTENEPTIPNAAISSFSCYYPDGSLFYTETPSQHAADNNPSCPAFPTLLSGTVSPPANATAYSYDTDGDEVQVIDHKGGATSTKGTTTTKIYDGLDQLVETIMPEDLRTLPNGSQTYDCYPFAWMTRYIYDISMQGGNANLTIGNVSGIAGYGGLYKTKEYLPSSATMQSCTVSNPQWEDVRGSNLDALGRVVDKYEVAFGNAPETINTYDGTNQLGLLSEAANTVPGGSQTITYTYDYVNHVKEVDFGGPAPNEDNRTYTFDADGRTASITAATLGQMSYSYDVDGNKITQSDPANENNASTVSYTYYPDGMRKYLSISGAIRKSDLLSYSYRQDGILDYQAVNWQSSQGTFLWTFTPGGRELSETDPLTGSPPVTTTYYYRTNYPPYTGSVTYVSKQYSYDPFGRVSSLTLPEGYAASNMQYDDDDELAGSSNTLENLNGQSQATSGTNFYVLSARGELLSAVGCSSNCGGFHYAQSANGTIVSVVGGVQDTNAATSWDVRSGMTLNNPWTVPLGTQGGSGSNQYGYDNSGRQITDTLSIANFNPSTYSRTYDPENHLIAAPTGDACNYVNGFPCGFPNATLSWGPDGRLRGIALSGNGTQNDDIHWDGDTLLFVGGANGASTLYIGKLATTGGSGDFKVADRDQKGIEESYHGNAAFGPWLNHNFSVPGESRFGFGVSAGVNWGSCYVSSADTGAPPCPQALPPTASDGLLLDFARADGYSLGTFSVQGVRSYDSTSQQWTTPDVYAGDVSSPISQKPFIWNGNNPVSYADPSGYYTFGFSADPTDEAAYEQEFTYFAQQLDALVESKLKDPNLLEKDREALEKLHDDLQPGKGSWVVTFGPTVKGSNAETFVRIVSGGIVVTNSQFNMKAINSEASREFEKAIATEGGAYEIDSGRLGSALVSQAEKIYHNQKSGPLGNLTNQYFTEPLGLGKDTMPSTPYGRP